MTEHLSRREAFLRECGGFELLRAHYFLDAGERARVYDLFNVEAPTALSDRRGRRTRFVDVAQPA